MVLKPANISFEEASTILVAGITALQALRDKGKIHSGQNVLIIGASGGVGTFAVQLAKYFGAEVTGVCSARNLDLVRSIGADKAIDYTKEDFTNTNQRYDLIIDNVANRSVNNLKRALSPNGICVIVGFSSCVSYVSADVPGTTDFSDREQENNWIRRGEIKQKRSASAQRSS